MATNTNELDYMFWIIWTSGHKTELEAISALSPGYLRCTLQISVAWIKNRNTNTHQLNYHVSENPNLKRYVNVYIARGVAVDTHRGGSRGGHRGHRNQAAPTGGGPRTIQRGCGRGGSRGGHRGHRNQGPPTGGGPWTIQRGVAEEVAEEVAVEETQEGRRRRPHLKS